jgi:hypothetical protein
MTPGVLLRKLGSDPDLREFTHVMIDEASYMHTNTHSLCLSLSLSLSVCEVGWVCGFLCDDFTHVMIDEACACLCCVGWVAGRVGRWVGVHVVYELLIER